MVRFSSPLAASALSRICSAGRRRFGQRASSWLSGSRAAASAGRDDDWRNVADETMRRCSAFTSQPLSMKRSGKPVEQLGMRRQRALAAEVLRRGDDAAAEMHAPDAVDDDARGQRIAAARQPAREAQPIARLIAGKRRQARRRVARDHLAGRIVGAALRADASAAACRISSITMISGTSADERVRRHAQPPKSSADARAIDGSMHAGQEMRRRRRR